VGGSVTERTTQASYIQKKNFCIMNFFVNIEKKKNVGTEYHIRRSVVTSSIGFSILFSFCTCAKNQKNKKTITNSPHKYLDPNSLVDEMQDSFLCDRYIRLAQ
jgi:hypothetical protein